MTAYIKTIWKNLSTPAINETNLNKLEEGIYDATEGVTGLEGKVTDLESPLSVDYTPQGTAPSHKEGRVFYDNNSHALSYYNDVDDMTLNIGQEVIVRVHNATGAT